MKTVHRILRIAFWCVLGGFIGTTIYTCYDYFTRPGLYALTSAPWYTSIVLHGVFTAITASALLAILCVIKRKLK